MSDIIPLGRLPEEIRGEALRGLLLVIRRLARACNAERWTITNTVRIIGGYEVTVYFRLDPRVDVENAIKRFNGVEDYMGDKVHIRIANISTVYADLGLLKAVLNVYLYGQRWR